MTIVTYCEDSTTLTSSALNWNTPGSKREKKESRVNDTVHNRLLYLVNYQSVGKVRAQNPLGKCLLTDDDLALVLS